MTNGSCLRHPMRRRLQAGCAKCPRWKVCAVFGCGTIAGTASRCTGARRTTSHRLPCSSVHPSTLKARHARKHTTQWVGFKVHLTEIRDDDLPHLFPNVETTMAPAADGDATPRIHAALQRRSLLPVTYIADTGLPDAELLVDSRGQYGVYLLGPMRLDYRWQAHAGARFGTQHSWIDWERRHATYLEGENQGHLDASSRQPRQ